MFPERHGMTAWSASCPAFPARRLLWLLVAGLGLAGCGPGRIPVPPLDPAGAAQQALAAYDTNRDGVLDGKELAACPGLKAALPYADLDRDGHLSGEEIAARVRKYQEDKAGLIFLRAVVTLDGKPLPDATVTLVPEPFLGRGVPGAQGTTDASGQCVLQTEGYDVPGVSCGIFQVRVSAKDSSGNERLSARYHTQTTLGVEVAMGNRVIAEGLELNLTTRGGPAAP
jgi:hypothetical protein